MTKMSEFARRIKFSYKKLFLSEKLHGYIKFNISNSLFSCKNMSSREKKNFHTWKSWVLKQQSDWDYSEKVHYSCCICSMWICSMWKVLSRYAIKDYSRMWRIINLWKFSSSRTANQSLIWNMCAISGFN